MNITALEIFYAVARRDDVRQNTRSCQSERLWHGALLALAGILTMIAACSSETTPVPPRSASFETRLEAALLEIQARNLSTIVGLSHNGAGTELYEFGALANDDIPPELTQIDINSITKTVTGTMVAKLVEQGRLRFDERLDKILANVPPDKAGITVHQLLTHSAGLPESVGDDGEELGRGEFLSRVWATDLLSRPGATYRYSNVGYGVLAALIEARSGKSYEAYLRDSVLPSGRFPNTGYEAVYKPEQSARTASGDPIREASWGGHQPYWNLIGNGGLVSTVPEMIAFRKALRQGELIAPELVQVVQQPHIREGNDAPSFYGYGLVVQDVPEIGRFYWHDGGNDVFSAHWADFIEQGDVLFTAGKNEAAFTAMSILARYLYGIGDYGQ